MSTRLRRPWAYKLCNCANSGEFLSPFIVEHENASTLYHAVHHGDRNLREVIENLQTHVLQLFCSHKWWCERKISAHFRMNGLRVVTQKQDMFTSLCNPEWSGWQTVAQLLQDIRPDYSHFTYSSAQQTEFYDFWRKSLLVFISSFNSPACLPGLLGHVQKTFHEKSRRTCTHLNRRQALSWTPLVPETVRSPDSVLENIVSRDLFRWRAFPSGQKQVENTSPNYVRLSRRDC